MAFALATEQASVDPSAAVRRYFEAADRFPRSPFAPKALAAVLQQEEGAASEEEQLTAARQLLSGYAGHREAERGAEVLGQYYPAQVKAEELLSAAQVAARIGPNHRRPTWLLRQAELEAKLGRSSDALRLAHEALQSARTLQAFSAGNNPEAMEMRPHQGRLVEAATRAEALIKRLEGRS